jgi:hypothetical protein
MIRSLLLTLALGAPLLVASHAGGARGLPRLPAPATPRKLALLVGAWDYGRGEFLTLKSEGRTPGPLEDVGALRRVLVGRFGFRDEDVKVLTSREETTRASIVETFKSFLVGRAAPGDVVYFHYSGHGSQLPDADTFDVRRRLVNKNPVVDEPDGLDETLVPTDYGANGANEIRDDEVNSLVASLMERRPASVILTFDSCHSGTVVRGGELARGKAWEQRSDWVGPKPRVRPGPALRAGASDGFLEPGAAAARDYVAISAAQEKERAWQVYDSKKRLEMGRFTDALVTALSEADSGATYEDLFARIGALMANRYSDQHPQFEGRRDKTLLGGAFKDRPKYLPAYTNNRGELILDAGALQGMTEGSVVALYASDADDLAASAPLASAEVKAVRLSDSTLALRTGSSLRPSPDAPLSLKGVEVEHRYGPERIALLVEDAGRLTQAGAVLRALRDLPACDAGVKAGEPWDLRLRPAAEGSAEARGRAAWLLERPDGARVGLAPDAEGAAEAIVAAVKREAKWRYAKSLENRNPQSLVRVRMRVVRVEATGDDARGYSYVRDAADAPNPARLRVGDLVAVEVLNLGRRDAYAALFDLSSEGDIVQLWPDPAAPITDNFISAADGGKWVRLWSEPGRQPALFRVTEPRGTDIFKLISTRKHVNFDELRTRSALPPLDSMLRDVIHGAGAPAAPLNVSDDWYTDALTFEVIP